MPEMPQRAGLAELQGVMKKRAWTADRLKNLALGIFVAATIIETIALLIGRFAK